MRLGPHFHSPRTHVDCDDLGAHRFWCLVTRWAAEVSVTDLEPGTGPEGTVLRVVPFGVPSPKRVTKQVGIRLPVDLWTRTLVVAAASGKRPGAYVAEVLEVALQRGEKDLRARLKVPKAGGRRAS